MRPETAEDLFARFGRAYVPLVMAAGMMASFIMVVSSTIVNVAVPDVMGAFGIGQDQAQLMATAFNVSMTASQLLNAWVVAVLGQRYGFAAALIILASAVSSTPSSGGSNWCSRMKERPPLTFSPSASTSASALLPLGTAPREPERIVADVGMR